VANQVDSPKNPGFYGGLVAKAAPLAWGMALCSLVTLVAMTIQAVEETLVGHPYVEAIVIVSARVIYYPASPASEFPSAKAGVHAALR